MMKPPNKRPKAADVARRVAVAGGTDYVLPRACRVTALFFLLVFLIVPRLQADCVVRSGDGRLFKGKVVITRNSIRLHRMGAPDLFFRHEQVAQILMDKACAPSSEKNEFFSERPKPRRLLKMAAFNGQPIDLDVQDARLQDVLMVLAETGGLSYIFTLPLDERVTLHVKNVPWDQLLDLLSRMYRFSYQINDHVLVIGPLKDP